MKKEEGCLARLLYFDVRYAFTFVNGALAIG
jgi:hypothetical protein